MVKAKTLFMQRLTISLKLHYEMLKTVFDWTVILYMVLPTLIIGAFVYKEWWNELPDYLSIVPIEAILFFTFSTFFMISLRAYIYKQDQLFLIQNMPILRRISLCGLFYTCLIATLISLVSFMITLPLFIHKYDYGFKELSFLFVYDYLFFITVILLRKYIHIHIHSQIIRIIILIATLLFYLYGWTANDISYFILFLIICAILIVSITSQLLVKKSNFIELVEFEIEADRILSTILLKQSGVLIYPGRNLSEKSFWLKTSKPLIKQGKQEDVLVDSFIKTVLRDQSSVVFFLKLSIWILAAILIIHATWLKILLWGFSLYTMVSWVNGMFKVFMQSSLIKFYRLEPVDIFAARNKSICWLTFIPVLTFSIITGYDLLSFIGSLSFSLMSILFLRYIVPLISMDI